MSGKFYPPSKEKLEILRKNGAFVLSEDLVSLFVVLGFVLSSFYFFNNYLDQFAILLRQALVEQSDYRNLFAVFFRLLTKSILIFLMPMTILAVFAVLIQSKFLISFSFFYMRFDNIFGGAQKLRDNYKKNISIFFLSLFKIAILFSLLYFFILNLIEVEILEYSFFQLVQEKAGLLKQCVVLQTSIIKIFLLSLLVMTIVSVFSLLFSHIYFRKVHAMTSEEFLAELD